MPSAVDIAASDKVVPGEQASAHDRVAQCVLDLLGVRAVRVESKILQCGCKHFLLTECALPALVRGRARCSNSRSARFRAGASVRLVVHVDLRFMLLPW